MVSEIVFEPKLAEALEGLEQFSHIIVVFFMHKVAPQRDIPAKVHPRGQRELPLMGLFATRAPHRPNHIGIKTVKLLERRDNVLKVKGLDAVNGTPIIDIKPYLPGYDSPPEATRPNWATK